MGLRFSVSSPAVVHISRLGWFLWKPRGAFGSQSNNPTFGERTDRSGHSPLALLLTSFGTAVGLSPPSALASRCRHNSGGSRYTGLEMRSEERRVGKECRSGGRQAAGKERIAKWLS